MPEVVTVFARKLQCFTCQKVREAATTSYGTQRRELRLSYEKQTCVLTPWGAKAINCTLRNDMLSTIKCIVPTNDFNHQR
uniref:Uncharacterized protein n=1 Tax=Magallana gigas TaxID=29159 RepID=A0A8W8MM27_MAGGI